MNIEVGSEWRLKDDHDFTCKVKRIEDSGTVRTDIPPRNNKYDFAGGFCNAELFLKLFEPITQAEPVKQKHAHYYKDVSRLNKIDIYAVCRLFGVTDPEISHAVKKLLCIGDRGHKDRNTDMQEAIDTLQRWQELEREFADD